MSEKQPFISVVTSLYNSAPYITEFHERMCAALQKLTDRYEIILVDDGSPDDALKKAVELQKLDDHVVVIELSRNFGQHKAMLTGVRHSKGDYVFLIEVDLEEQPEWIGDFYEKLTTNEDADVVFGVQKARKGGLYERLTGALFYKVFNLLADVKMPENHITTRLMSRRYVDGLLSYRDKELFLGAVYELVGFKQIPLLVTKESTSETTYTFKRKLILLGNALTSFSAFPLMMMFWGGLLMSFFAFVFIIYVVIKWIVISARPGWTSLIASIWLVGGLQMLSIGTIGLYLKKVLEEVKDRPYTVIKEVYENSKTNG